MPLVHQPTRRFPARPKLSKAPKPNFQALWTVLMGVAEQVKDDKFKAVLTNHANRQEYICRKFGVIGANDVERIAKKLAKSIGKART